jgi:hypothetical protein
MHKIALISDRTAQIYAALAAFIFFGSGLVYLWWGHWPVTHLDYWVQYEFALNHTWLETALDKHADHLMFFPSFFWLADLRFFHGDQELLFTAGLVLLSLTVSLLLTPVWRDKTVGLTAKLIATLVIILGNFWMARAHITGSGGFNCICSLVTASAALAFLLLPRIGASIVRSLPATLIVVCAGFVASFSFGTGLAIWPTLLFLAWCLRLPWRSVVPLGIATVATIVIYQRVPPHLAEYRMIQEAASAGLALVIRVCRLAGSPFFYAASGWHAKPLSLEAAQSSVLAPLFGGAGITLAVVAMVFTVIRRDLARSSLKFIGMALVTFTFGAMAMIVVGNCLRGPRFQSEFLLPRYLFWTTLFWTGLLLVFIQYAESKPWLRWPVWLVAFVLPVLAFPQHYRTGLNARWARAIAEYGAVSLVNGVRDDRQVKIFGGDPKRIYRVADQFRVRRLDMFADGLQDWIGLREADLLRGRRKRQGLTGDCGVVALVPSDDGVPAARVVGHAREKLNVPNIVRWAITPMAVIVGQEIKKGYVNPRTLVIVDPSGIVRGIARSSPTNPFINRVFCVFYMGKVEANRFLGYIRNYDPKLKYAIRSVDDGALSEETIPVQQPANELEKP